MFIQRDRETYPEERHTTERDTEIQRDRETERQRDLIDYRAGILRSPEYGPGIRARPHRGRSRVSGLPCRGLQGRITERTLIHRAHRCDSHSRYLPKTYGQMARSRQGKPPGAPGEKTPGGAGTHTGHGTVPCLSVSF